MIVECSAPVCAIILLISILVCLSWWGGDQPGLQCTVRSLLCLSVRHLSYGWPQKDYPFVANRWPSHRLWFIDKNAFINCVGDSVSDCRERGLAGEPEPEETDNSIEWVLSVYAITSSSLCSSITVRDRMCCLWCIDKSGHRLTSLLLYVYLPLGSMLLLHDIWYMPFRVGLACTNTDIVLIQTLILNLEPDIIYENKKDSDPVVCLLLTLILLVIAGSAKLRTTLFGIFSC